MRTEYTENRGDQRGLHQPCVARGGLSLLEGTDPGVRLKNEQKLSL